MTDHLNCGTLVSDQAWVPTRLIDLHCSSENGLDMVRTCITKDENVHGPYMTLSHRWPQEHLKTTRLAASMAAGQKINVTALPQTFQDAIYVTRTFGIRWLWIDCFCILQDSDEDFLLESTVMHKVYGNSRCNISATGASDHDQTLFTKHDRDMMHPLPLRLALRGFRKTQRWCLFKDVWAFSIQNAGLNRRAWVVQERYLAPRVLHFAKGQLFWECRELNACELYPKGLPPCTYDLFNFKTTLVEKRQTKEVGLRKIEVHEIWNGIVRAYSQSALTKSSDKLIALAGLASYFQEVLQDDYLAGLWRSTLTWDLLWKRLTGSASRPSTYRGPSWSWASIDGIVGLDDRHRPSKDDMHRINDVFTIPRDKSSPFGEVLGARLNMSCRLVRIELSEPMTDDAHWDRPEIVMDGHKLQSFWLLPDVIGESSTSIWGAFLFRDRGLLLKPVDELDGIFSRVGMFALVNTEPVPTWLDHVTEQAATYPCQSFDEERGWHTFTIT
jgi:hypothetical protein